MENTSFEIFPAIDIIDGKCVMLKQGDYKEVTVYSDNPLSMALSFKNAGAKNIHIIDLDAAKTGNRINNNIISEIAKKTGLFVQTGGGIRNMETLKNVLKSGVSRAILGTAAVRDKKFIKEAVNLFGEKIAIGVDAKDGEVAVQGWTESGNVNVIDFVKQMENLGVKTIIYTDISLDGMLSGIPTEMIKNLLSKTSLNVIASGGISSQKDIDEAKRAGACAVIIGKAIYEGKVDLKKCLQRV